MSWYNPFAATALRTRGYLENRRGYARVLHAYRASASKQQQLRTETLQSAADVQSQAAADAGASGSRLGKDAIAHRYRINLSRLAPPPAPPKPPAPTIGQPRPYEDPRDIVGGPAVHRRNYYLHRRGKYAGRRQQGYGALTTYGYPDLTPEQWDAEKQRADAQFVRDTQVYNEINAAYNSELSVYNARYAQYVQGVQEAAQHNQWLDANRKDYEASQARVKESTAESGRATVGSRQRGIGQGATSTSPGIAKIPRPNTAWLNTEAQDDDE